MAQYVSLENLKYYDGKIKEWAMSYKGAATALPTAPLNGDLYKFNIAAVPESTEGAGDSKPAMKGYFVYNSTTTSWDAISDAALTEAVEKLEEQVGKDKEVNAYKDAEDLVDIVNLLTSAVTEEGSVLNEIYTEAANAKYGEKLVEDENGVLPGADGYVETKADVSIKEAIENIGEVAAAEAKVTIDTASTDTGYLKTYAFYQGLKGTESEAEKLAKLIGKVNIPKDFLVKSGEIVTFEDGDTLPDGVTEAGKYLALTINVAADVAGDEAEDQIVYINVKDLVDVYTVKSAEDVANDGDEVQLALSEDLELSATLVDGTIARTKIDEDFEADLAAIEAAIGEHQNGEDEDGNAIMELYAVADRIKAEAKDGIYKPAVAGQGVEGDPDYVAPQDAVTIAEALDSLKADIEDFEPIKESDIDLLFA